MRWKDGPALQLSHTPGYGKNKLIAPWTYIDRKGDVQVKLTDTFKDAKSFSEGMAAVKSNALETEDLWGFVNTTFAIVVPHCFLKITDFKAGLAYVEINVEFNVRKGCERYYQDKQFYQDSKDPTGTSSFYIDKTGNIVKPQW